MWQMTCPRRHPGLRLLTGKDDDVMFVCVLINLLFDNMNMLIDFLLTGLQSHPQSYARLQKLFLWRHTSNFATSVQDGILSASLVETSTSQRGLWSSTRGTVMPDFIH